MSSFRSLAVPCPVFLVDRAKRATTRERRGQRVARPVDVRAWTTGGVRRIPQLWLSCAVPSLGVEMAAVDEHSGRHATRHSGKQAWTRLTQAGKQGSRLRALE